MSIRTVKVSNVSLSANQQHIKEFFSYSGEVEYIEEQSHNEQSQVAYVTFKDSQGADTAVLLSGATIVDQSVTIALAPDYILPDDAAVEEQTTDPENKTPDGDDSVAHTAEDVVSSMLARGFILGKDALNKAKSFDEKHQFTSTASARVTSFDQRIGLTEKISVGSTIVNEKVRDLDHKYQVSEKTKSAYAAAEQTVSTAGSAIMKNRYVFTGVSWVTGAFNRAAKAAEEVSQKTKEKVMAEEEQERRAGGYTEIDTDHPKPPMMSEQPPNPPPAQGLIL